jgi:hypothetical protein
LIIDAGQKQVLAGTWNVSPLLQEIRFPVPFVSPVRFLAVSRPGFTTSTIVPLRVSVLTRRQVRIPEDRLDGYGSLKLTQPAPALCRSVPLSS